MSSARGSESPSVRSGIAFNGALPREHHRFAALPYMVRERGQFPVDVLQLFFSAEASLKRHNMPLARRLPATDEWSLFETFTPELCD